MKPLTLLIISFAFCLGASGQEVDSLKPQKIDEKTIVGKYKAKYNPAYGDIFWLKIKKNGKFIHRKKRAEMYDHVKGTWEIKNDTLYVHVISVRFRGKKIMYNKPEDVVKYIFVKGDIYFIHKVGYYPYAPAYGGVIYKKQN